MIATAICAFCKTEFWAAGRARFRAGFRAHVVSRHQSNSLLMLRYTSERLSEEHCVPRSEGYSLVEGLKTYVFPLHMISRAVRLA
jgi:hypothetical protein